jgi:hypothetical protein
VDGRLAAVGHGDRFRHDEATREATRGELKEGKEGWLLKMTCLSTSARYLGP